MRSILALASALMAIVPNGVFISGDGPVTSKVTSLVTPWIVRSPTRLTWPFLFGLRDALGLEGQRRELRHVEEVGRLQVRVALRLARVDGAGVDRHVDGRVRVVGPGPRRGAGDLAELTAHRRHHHVLDGEAGRRVRGIDGVFGGVRERRNGGEQKSERERTNPIGTWEPPGVGNNDARTQSKARQQQVRERRGASDGSYLILSEALLVLIRRKRSRSSGSACVLCACASRPRRCAW